MTPYSPEVEAEMKKFFGTLSEKDQRRYAGIEAMKLGRGGIGYIAGVLGCDRDRVSAGIQELTDLPKDSEYDPRIRQAGGGRKPYEEQYPNIDEQFLSVLEPHTAGDPMDETIRWTNLSQVAIAQRLAEQYDVLVSRTVIEQLMRKHNYRLRKAQKKQP